MSPSTATVSGGTATFTVRRGVAIIGFATAPVSAGAATVTFALNGLTAFPYSIDVSYGGTANFNGSSLVDAATLTVKAKPTTLTLGITDLTGVRLAVTADVKALANWNATGLFSFAFSTPYSVTTDGAVYACILKDGVYGTTEPQIATMTAVTGSGAALGSNAALGVTQAAQTSIGTTVTWTANASFPWLALV